MPYIGRSSNFGVRTRFLYTATASQTTFSGTDTQNLTLSYSDSNFIDVHQNGVLLKVVDDYTATSGTSVVLATGATASDVIEITVYDVFSIANHIKKTGDAMAGALTNIDIDGTELVLDADGDTSITADTDDQIDFKTGGSDRVIIDSSGNLMVGKTSISGLTVGGEIRSNGLVLGVVDDNFAGYFARQSQDGEIVRFVKDTTPVGSIGVVASDVLFLANPDGTGVGLNFDGDSPKINPSNGTGSGTDNVADLGNSSGRFKDLYLGGGLYVGGTGSANYLDDYEEGTWTPALVGPSSVAYSSQIGNYTKIGRMVWLSFSITMSSAPTGGSNYRITIPFDPEGSSSREYGGDIFMDTALTTSNYGHFLGVYNGTINVYVYTTAGAARSGSGAWQTGTLSGQIFINT